MLHDACETLTNHTWPLISPNGAAADLAITRAKRWERLSNTEPYPNA